MGSKVVHTSLVNARTQRNLRVDPEGLLNHHNRTETTEVRRRGVDRSIGFHGCCMETWGKTQGHVKVRTPISPTDCLAEFPESLEPTAGCLVL